MNCLVCPSKACKVSQKDCNGMRDEVIKIYRDSGVKRSLINADNLVANGKAGTLSRVDEIIEYAISENVKELAIAYCFAIEDLAIVFRNKLLDAGLKVTSVRCTVNGITEDKLLDNGKESVNCNPIGQAKAINQSNADLVIEMGLCLGHDILFHKYIEKPYTVLVVKDRVHNHAPLDALRNPPEMNISARFLSDLPNDFYLKTPAWVSEQIESGEKLTLIDFRGTSAFERASIPGSSCVSIKDLAVKYEELLPDKDSLIIAICNGGLQSIYVTMFLRMRNYSDVFSLTGGFARWQRENLKVVGTDSD